MRPAASRQNHLTVIAQDPAVLDRRGGDPDRSRRPPPGAPADGPWGYRVQVIDFDTSTDTLHPPLPYARDANGAVVDPFAEADPSALIGNRRFHAQNVYALVMSTLARFEKALGRRVSWGFGHQIKVVPHAFADANAFYSRSDEALLFGYFRTQDGHTVHTCLSHDVIVHETTHALLDGSASPLRRPVVAGPGRVPRGVRRRGRRSCRCSRCPAWWRRSSPAKRSDKGAADNLIPRDAVDPENAEGVGAPRPGRADGRRADRGAGPGPAPVRRARAVSAKHAGRPGVPGRAPPRRAPGGGDDERVRARVVGPDEGPARGVGGYLDLQRVAEEGRDAADYLLTMSIRALDYTPPVHLEFCDYLSAIITADLEVRPDEVALPLPRASAQRLPRLRHRLRARQLSCPTTGRSAAAVATRTQTTAVQPPRTGPGCPCHTLALVYDRTHADPLARDVDEVFRFVWENRDTWSWPTTRSARSCPCGRPSAWAPDGFALRETVAEFYQVLRLRPARAGPSAGR